MIFFISFMCGVLLTELIIRYKNSVRCRVEVERKEFFRELRSFARVLSMEEVDKINTALS